MARLAIASINGWLGGKPGLTGSVFCGPGQLEIVEVLLPLRPPPPGFVHFDLYGTVNLRGSSRLRSAYGTLDALPLCGVLLDVRHHTGSKGEVHNAAERK